MSTENNRVAWFFTYEKGLVDILKELNNIPMCKGQNGWSAEGWRNITKKFNEKFPRAQFAKQQLQEKEKDLKSSYKILREARNCSGAGWNKSLGMIVVEPLIWEAMIAKNKNVSKFKKKSFPLYNDLALLHQGSVAIGDLNFTSTEVPPVAPAPTSHTLKRSNSEHSALNVAAGSESRGIDFTGTDPGPQGAEAQSAPEASNVNIEDQGGRGKKRKQNQIAAQLQDFLSFRKDHIQKTAETLDEKKRLGDDFSVEKCIDAVDAMEELTDEEKADANELWQSDMNRQIFMKTKNPKVRLIWLKKKILQKLAWASSDFMPVKH